MFEDLSSNIVEPIVAWMSLEAKSYGVIGYTRVYFFSED